MESRTKILEAIAKNQPELTPLPDLTELAFTDFDPLEKFKTILTSIGGQVIEVKNLGEVEQYIQAEFPDPMRVISTLPGLSPVAETDWLEQDPHVLENVDLCILEAEFGVAENGSVWLTEAQMGQRVAPFITQCLGIVLQADRLVPTMHHAYERIGAADYPFGMFLAGPSKTADIEQSLVLGAHGSRSLLLFLVEA